MKMDSNVLLLIAQFTNQFRAQGAFRQPNFSPTHVNTDYWGNQITAASYNHTNQIITLNRLLTVKMPQFLFKHPNTNNQ